MPKKLFPSEMAMIKISASFPHGMDASDYYYSERRYKYFNKL